MTTPHDLFRQVLADTGDRIAALGAIRQRFGLDLRQAEEVVLQAGGVAAPPDERQKGAAAESERVVPARPDRDRPAATPPGDSATPLLDQVSRPSRLLSGGLAIADLIDALEVLAATPGVRDKRILSLRLHRGGILYVRTGEATGGYRLVLEKNEGAWKVAELAKWSA